HRLIGEAEVGVDVRLGVVEPDLWPAEHGGVVGEDDGGQLVGEVGSHTQGADRFIRPTGKGERLCTAGPDFDAAAAHMVAGQGDRFVCQVDDLAGGPAFVGAADNLQAVDPRPCLQVA